MSDVRSETRPVRDAAAPFVLGTALVRWAPIVPLLIAGGYLAWLASSYSRVMAVIHINPDAAWAPVLVRDAAARGGSIFVGEASHLTTIWFLTLTRALPFRQAVWDWAPLAIFLAGIGLTAWACWRVAGKGPALICFALGSAATATVLLTVLAEGIRGHTFFVVGLLSACLVWLATASRLRWPVVALMAMSAGATLASDPLFLAVGLAPMAAAPIVLWMAERTRASRSLALMVLGAAAAAVIVDKLIWIAMGAAGFRKNYLKSGYSFATPAQMGANVKEFANHLLGLANGYFFDHQGALRAGRMAMAVLIGLSILYCAYLAIRIFRKGEPALKLYIAFWLLSAGGTFAAFVLSTFPAGPSDSSRYVIPFVFALTALVPLGARNTSWRRVAVAAGAAGFCLLSIAAREEIFAYERVPGFKTLLDEGPSMISFLQGQGATRGYGGYFTSHQLSLMSDMKVQVYPIIACHQPDDLETLCPFSVNTRTSWYRPRAGSKSFLVYDSTAPAFISPAPTSGLGPPAAQKQFGSISVSVFDYDIASRFDPPCLDTPTFVCAAS